ncbi:Dual specificity mitogen-activated protein kinase kinase 7 [Plecturocebus cupreus]
MAASSLEQKLSRLEAKLKQENREARRRIDLNLDISPQRPRPSKHGAVGEGAGGAGRAPREAPPPSPGPAPASGALALLISVPPVVGCRGEGHSDLVGVGRASSGGFSSSGPGSTVPGPRRGPQLMTRPHRRHLLGRAPRTPRDHNHIQVAPKTQTLIVITLSPAPAPSQRAALQLPLANDGGSRSPSSESSPQHPMPPARPRHMLGLPSTLFTPRSMESIEIDQKLQEIMKQTGYLTIGGQRYQAEINDLENLGEMGSGTCGQVWKMRFRKTGHVIAVKVSLGSHLGQAPRPGLVLRLPPFLLSLPVQQMRRSGNKEENKRILMDLDVVLKSHDCPYIVQCFGTFITNTDVFIAMELMGTCAEKLKKRMQGPIPERILGKMTVAIVKALFYLKEKHGVIHRDVKPSNILLDERGQIKLCDFGISGRLVDSKAKTRSAGCAAYMAPERIDPPDPTKPDYDIRADVWSLGISLVELATGQFPYKNCKTDFEVLTKVLQEEPPLLPGHMGFSGDFQSFVKDCLTKDHRKRPKYNKLLEHSFIKHYETLEVDVASWFKDVMAKTESPRTSSVLSQPHLPFFR